MLSTPGLSLTMPDNEGSIEELAGWVALVKTIDIVTLQLLQKTAFSLVKGRHALGSPGWLFVRCLDAKNGIMVFEAP